MLFDVRDRSAKPANSHSPTLVNGKHQPPKKSIRLANLDILDGIRVFAIFWIIVAHCASFTQVPNLMKLSPFSHYPNDILRLKNQNWLISFYLTSSYFPVSVFFLLSGVLIMFNRKRNLNCSGRFHFIQTFVTRYLRLAPVLLFMMAINYYMRYLGSGPLFHQKLVEPYTEPCRRSFWYHIFMIHNFLLLPDRCGSHSWYVAADFQLTLLAFFVVHLARCRSKWFTGLFGAFGIMAVASFIPLCLILLGFGQLPNFDHFIDPRKLLPTDDFTVYYYATYNHAGSFFVGVVLGFVLSSGWDFSFLIKNKMLRFTLLNLSAGTMAVVPFSVRYFVFPHDLMDGDSKSPLLSAIMFQFFSYAFVVALSIFIFICALKKMYVSRYLGARILRPMSRLVFSTYLFHQLLIWFTLQQGRYPHTLNFYSQITFSAMVLSLSPFISMFIYVMIECPFIRISKLIFPAKSADDRPKSELMMRSISTAEESFTRSPRGGAEAGGDAIEFESLAHHAQADAFRRPFEDRFVSIDLADQNNNSNGNGNLASNS